MRAAILTFPGVEELDFVAPYEVLSVARDLGADLSLVLAARGEPGRLAAGNGLDFHAPVSLSEAGRCDLLVIPGGTWLAGTPNGVRLALTDKDLLACLRRKHEGGCVLAAICTGAFLLAEAGLLQGRPATTHHEAWEDLRDRGVEVRPERVVDDGSILTAGGITSGLDLSLWLVERFFGSPLRERVEARLEYRRQGEVYQRGAR